MACQLKMCGEVEIYFYKYFVSSFAVSVVGKCTKKSTMETDTDYQEYGNFDRNDIGGRVARINQTLNPPVAFESFNNFSKESEKRSQSPYQSSFYDNNSFGNKFQGAGASRPHSYTEELSLSRSNDKSCAMQCFFQELKMV